MKRGGQSQARVGWLGAAAALVIGALLVPAAQRVSSQTAEKASPPATKAAEGDQPAGGEKRTAKPVEVVHVDLLSVNGPVYTLTTTTEQVHFRQEDADLYCDQAEYNEDTDKARATGHLKLTTRDAVVTGDLITTDFGQKVADITGNVHMEVQRKPKPEATAETKPGEAAPPEPKAGEEKADEKPGRFDEYREKLTHITCEHVQYWYEEERAVATGSVVAVQEDKTVYADEAVYLRNDNEETLTLTASPVKLVMKNGNNAEAPKVVIDLRSETVTAFGAAGIFKREKKEGEKPEGQPEAPATPAPETKSETPAPPPPPAKP